MPSPLSPTCAWIRSWKWRVSGAASLQPRQWRRDSTTQARTSTDTVPTWPNGSSFCSGAGVIVWPVGTPRGLARAAGKVANTRYLWYAVRAVSVASGPRNVGYLRVHHP